MVLMDSGGGIILIMLVLPLLFLSYNVNSVVEGRNFSQEDYSQMKAYLKMMNKPAIMSIKTDDGGLYDCVDIYKQPAFDHPLLKNHILQMEPTSYPNGTRREKIDYETQNIGLKDGGCPEGYVPIRRTQERDFLLTNSSLRFGMKLPSEGSRYYAVTKTMPGEYYGTRATMNVWNPKVLNAGSFSASQLWIAAGHGLEQNYIQVGLVVAPQMYGDSRTRLFVYWTADNFHNTGCLNTKCPGFVQVNRRMPIDGYIRGVSTYKGAQYEIELDVLKDPKSGNWYLLKEGITLGYWPSALFNHLNTKAESMEFGGEVSKCGGCPFPQMGSGYSSDGGFGVAAFMKDLQVIDSTDMVLKYPKEWRTSENRKNCYSIHADLSGPKYFFYGGPGC